VSQSCLASVESQTERGRVAGLLLRLLEVEYGPGDQGRLARTGLAGHDEHPSLWQFRVQPAGHDRQRRGTAPEQVPSAGAAALAKPSAVEVGAGLARATLPGHHPAWPGLVGIGLCPCSGVAFLDQGVVRMELEVFRVVDEGHYQTGVQNLVAEAVDPGTIRVHKGRILGRLPEQEQ